MDFVEYAERSGVTAIYPTAGKGELRGLSYACLGLTGESGEIATKAADLLAFENGFITDKFKDSLVLELGDVMWYVAAMCREVGSSLDKVMTECKWTVKMVDGLMLNTLRLNGLAGNVAERTKKLIRDKNGVVDEEYTAEVCKNLYAIVRFVDRAAQLMGSDLSTVMAKNVEKLESRKKRGKLKGDGDNR